MPPKTVEHVYEESVALAKSSEPKYVQNGKLYKWRGSVTSYIISELKCYCLPYFSITVFDSNFTIPCIILNPVRNVNKLLKLCDHTILINEPEFIVEIFMKDSSEYCLVYILINVEKLHMIEKNIKMFTKSLKQPKSDTLVIRKGNSSDEWCQQCIPLKISSAVLTLKSEIFCFLLVVLVNSEKLDSEEYTEPVWLILRNEQVVWKDFFLPNRIYSIYNSTEVSRDYFKCYGSLFSVIDKNLDQSFHQMMHHKDLIRTNAAIFLPKKSKIYTSSKNTLKMFCPETWFSISDTKLHSLKFASVYGIIKEIKYFESWKSGSCLWCNTNDNLFEATLKIPEVLQNETENNDNNFESNNPAFNFLNNVEDDNICFPETPFFVPGRKNISGFGIKGGKLTVQISLQKPGSDDVVYIFFKRWQQEQYPAGLIEGVTVCFSDLNIKRSQKKNLYFIATPLTRVFHLSTADVVRHCDFDRWKNFGFPNIRILKQEIWGMLDLDLLNKVSIIAKCKICKNPFIQFCCSNVMCSNSQKQMCPDYEVTATARLFVRGFLGFEASALFLKNENVQKYLGIPGGIWLKLCLLSANSELLFTHQRDPLLLQYQNENEDIIRTFFRTYCQFFRPKIRFHVLCRSFKSENDENKYFGIELREITEQRLLATRNAVDKAISKQ